MPHSIEEGLADYPIYVSVKGDHPGRIEELAAAALRAKWEKTEDGVRLIPIKVSGDEDLPEFTRQLTIALKGKPLEGLSAPDLYHLHVGQIIRYGQPTNDLILELPESLKKAITQMPADVRLRRFCFGIYDCGSSGFSKDVEPFSDGDTLTFLSLPPDVERLLKPDLDKPALTPEQAAALKRVNNPTGFKVDYVHPDQTDPIQSLMAICLGNVGDQVEPDLVIALPDLCLIAGIIPKDDHSVRKTLESYAAVDVWSVVDDAAVAKLPVTEVVYPQQTRRHVLAVLFSNLQAYGAATLQQITQYVSQQRPGASESWADVMLLAFGHIAIDDDHIGDYPYNIRLAGVLTDEDWRLLRSGKPFPLSAFSDSARSNLFDILLESRARMTPDDEQYGGDIATEPGTRQIVPDPARWASLNPRDLLVKAELSEDKVLVGWVNLAAEVMPADNAGLNYDHQRKELTEEPLYQPATRQKLKLTITNVNEGYIETGFSELSMLPDTKRVAWSNLPEPYRSEFKKGLDEEAAAKAAEQKGTPKIPPNGCADLATIMPAVASVGHCPVHKRDPEDCLSHRAE